MACECSHNCDGHPLGSCCMCVKCGAYNRLCIHESDLDALCPCTEYKEADC